MHLRKRVAEDTSNGTNVHANLNVPNVISLDIEKKTTTCLFLINYYFNSVPFDVTLFYN